jgi:type IV secretory pathway VirB3-like protein
MKEELLKSVARPAQVFYAPFGLAVLNLALAAYFILVLLLFGMGGYIWLPIVGFILLHGVLILVGRREPHIDSMLAARRRVNTKTRNMIKESGNKFTP